MWYVFIQVVPFIFAFANKHLYGCCYLFFFIYCVRVLHNDVFFVVGYYVLYLCSPSAMQTNQLERNLLEVAWRYMESGSSAALIFNLIARWRQLVCQLCFLPPSLPWQSLRYSLIIILDTSHSPAGNRITKCSILFKTVFVAIFCRL